jgi:hypothetical protein
MAGDVERFAGQTRAGALAVADRPVSRQPGQAQHGGVALETQGAEVGMHCRPVSKVPAPVFISKPTTPLQAGKVARWVVTAEPDKLPMALCVPTTRLCACLLGQAVYRCAAVHGDRKTHPPCTAPPAPPPFCVNAGIAHPPDRAPWPRCGSARGRLATAQPRATAFWDPCRPGIHPRGCAFWPHIETLRGRIHTTGDKRSTGSPSAQRGRDARMPHRNARRDFPPIQRPIR